MNQMKVKLLQDLLKDLHFMEEPEEKKGVEVMKVKALGGGDPMQDATIEDGEEEENDIFSQIAKSNSPLVDDEESEGPDEELLKRFRETV